MCLPKYLLITRRKKAFYSSRGTWQISPAPKQTRSYLTVRTHFEIMPWPLIQCSEKGITAIQSGEKHHTNSNRGTFHTMPHWYLQASRSWKERNKRGTVTDEKRREDIKYNMTEKDSSGKNCWNPKKVCSVVNSLKTMFVSKFWCLCHGYVRC